MKKKWEIIILTVIALALGIGVFSPVFSQWDGDGAFGSVVDYLKQVAASIWPSANNTYDLGSASKQWRNIYTANGINFNGTWQNSAATSASSSGNVGAIQFAGANSTFAGDAANLFYDTGASQLVLSTSSGGIWVKGGSLTVGAPYAPVISFGVSSALMHQGYSIALGWPGENVLQYEDPGQGGTNFQDFFEWFINDPLGLAVAGPNSCALMFTTQHLGMTNQFANWCAPTPVYLSNVNATSGNFVGFAVGMENQHANATTPFIRLHSVKGNMVASNVTTPETIPSFEIGDLGNQTTLPANADNGSLVVDRHIAALEGGAANGACCFMADGKTLGHCTGLVGANGTCTCAD